MVLALDENLGWGLDGMSKLNLGILNLGGGNIASVSNAVDKSTAVAQNFWMRVFHQLSMFW